jgi:hypothetical protein
MPKSGPGNSATTTGSSIADAYSGSGNSARHTSARHQDDSRFKAGRLKRYAGYLTGFAETFAGALNATRTEIIDLVDGEKPQVETEMVVNGNRGTDAPGGSTNRIKSDDYDREGVDRVFICTRLGQFEALASAVGAEVSVR